jgi:hypothetical protein
MPRSSYDLLIDIGNTFVKWGRYRAGAAGSAAQNCLGSGHLRARRVRSSPRWHSGAGAHPDLERRRRVRAPMLRAWRSGPTPGAAAVAFRRPSSAASERRRPNPAQLGLTAGPR